MRISPKFEATDAGFSRRIDAVAARRQFNLSIGLLAALAFSALLAAFTLRIPTPTGLHLSTRLTVQAPQFAPVQHAVRDMAGQRGG